jgi:hypothetical protein
MRRDARRRVTPNVDEILPLTAMRAECLPGVGCGSSGEPGVVCTTVAAGM